MDNNRANQLNPNHPSYWKSRGYPGRPSNSKDFSNGGSWLTTVFRAPYYFLKGIFTVIRGVYYLLVRFFGAKGATVIIAGTSIAGYYAYTSAYTKKTDFLTSFDVASRVKYVDLW